MRRRFFLSPRRARATGWFRTLTLACLLAFGGALTVEAHDLRSCAHHATHGEHGHEQAPVPAPAHDHHSTDHDSPHPDSADSEPTDPEPHGPCSCIGDCSGSTALVLPGPGSEDADVALVHAAPVPPDASALRALAPVPYLRPYALAPPPVIV